MARQPPTPRHASDSADVVLTKAVLRAADALGLSQADLATIIGVSAASISRLGNGRTIDPDTKEGELALYFLRVFRSTDTLVGGQSDKAQRWLSSYNTHLDGVPAELIRTIGGLVRVAEYLDAMRGKV